MKTILDPGEEDEQLTELAGLGCRVQGWGAVHTSTRAGTNPQVEAKPISLLSMPSGVLIMCDKPTQATPPSCDFCVYMHNNGQRPVTHLIIN